MKTAVIFFHKNLSKIYKPIWIEKSIASIKSQTYQDFDVFELNYGDDNIQYCNVFADKQYYFYNIKMKHYVYSMNYLIEKIFSMGYDVVFNTNMDDYYHPERFQKELDKINEGYQLVSSNFYYIEENDLGNDIITKNLNMVGYGDIKNNLNNDHNVVAHPCVAMHKSFYGGDLIYNNNLFGVEDLDLWKRAINLDKKFYILNDYLLYYRLHTNQVCNIVKNDSKIKNVALLIVATNHYTVYLKPLIESAEKYFLKTENVVYNIFTDKVSEVESIFKEYPIGKINIFKVKHKVFPYTALYRYHFFNEYREKINNYDNYVYIDADCLFNSEITTEVLGDIVPVQHGGFQHMDRSLYTYEVNPKSCCYIEPNEGTHYFGGGFWSFSNKEFWKLIEHCELMVDVDESKGIIPLWHDESVLNRYLIDNPPTKILSSEYHYPDPEKIPSFKAMFPQLKCKVLLIVKDHDKLRDTPATPNELDNIYTKIIKKNSLVFDIGANIGLKTDLFLSMGAKVISVEPQKGCFKILKSKFKGNKDVTLINKGAGANKTKSVIYIDTYGGVVNDKSGISTMSNDFKNKMNRFTDKGHTWNHIEECEMTTLDELIEIYGMPDFCKIDVEGYEIEVIKGLNKPIPFISLEYHPELHDNTINIIKLLKKINKDYKFNYSNMETLKYEFVKWVNPEELDLWLKNNIYPPIGYGDIYAKI